MCCGQSALIAVSELVGGELGQMGQLRCCQAETMAVGQGRKKCKYVDEIFGNVKSAAKKGQKSRSVQDGARKAKIRKAHQRESLLQQQQQLK